MKRSYETFVLGSFDLFFRDKKRALCFFNQRSAFPQSMNWLRKKDWFSAFARVSARVNGAGPQNQQFFSFNGKNVKLIKDQNTEHYTG
jgi:hypothetical protein